MLCDEWFDDFMKRVNRGGARERVLSELLPRHRDARFWETRAYEAETQALLAVLRADGGRGKVAVGEIPPRSQPAVDRFLERISINNQEMERA